MIDEKKLIEDLRKRKYISDGLYEIFATVVDEQPQINQWHVVADGDLPGNNEDYYKMKCFVDMKHIYSESSFRDVLWFNNGCWKWETGKKISDKYTVIAWQPFAYPQPYKERD